ncbi:homoserine kinase [Paenibacillus sp. TRM 82003]|nr:homoserine kinase [Paenibacillus sp. TRM 82003]
MASSAQGGAERVRAKVPATSANLGPGFDALGMALSMHAWIEMAPADETRIELIGERMKGLPTNKTNLVYVMAQRVFEEAGVAIPELEIAMYSDIPLTRGLGSSAAAIVGALGAANALIGEPLPRDELFRMATAIEGHPDNVGPAVFGGIVSAIWDGERATHIRLDPPEGLTTLVAIPAYELATHKARAALPDQVSRGDAVYSLSRAALLATAFATGRLDVVTAAMSDRLHEPYRAPLVPGLTRVLNEAAAHGALGAALSGAGPTAIAFVDERTGSARKRELEAFMREAMTSEPGAGSVELRWLAPAAAGLEIEAAASPLASALQGGLLS